MSYSTMATASCHGLYFINIASQQRNLKRDFAPIKRFHGVSTSSQSSIGDHLAALRFHSSYRDLVSCARSSNSTVVQMGNVADPSEYMLSKALAVNEALDKAIPLTYPEKLLESMRFSVLAGGKRVRPVLCIATCELLECSAVCGAIIGGASEDEIERIRRFSRCMGLLFQVVDDILDVTKSSQEIGKTAGKDLIGDKATYPKVMGLEKAKEFTVELLKRGKEELSCFDPTKAAPLLGLADYIAFRQN